MKFTNNNQIIIELPLDYEDFEKFVRKGTTPEQRTAIWTELYAIGRVPLDAVVAKSEKEARQAGSVVKMAREAILAIVLDNLRLGYYKQRINNDME